MAKGDKFYFDNFAASAALSKEAAEYLVKCLENYEPEKIEQMMQEALMRGEDISQFQNVLTTESIRCAQIIITTVPIIICYPFLQKYFIQGVTLGAVKD